MSKTSSNRRQFIVNSSATLVMASALSAPSIARAEEFNLDAVTAPRRLGSDDAPLKIVEFFSMTCSHCGAFHRETYPLLKENFIETGQMQFEMHPFPLDGLALRAHVMCRLLPNKGYFAMTELLLKEQAKWVTAADPLKELVAFGRQAGISEEKFNAAMRNRPLLEAVVDMRQDAMDDWQVNSTPTFVVNNDKKISGGRTYDEFLKELSAFGV